MIDTLGIRWIGKIDRNGKLIEVGDIVGIEPYKQEFYPGATVEGWKFRVWVKDRRTFYPLDNFDRVMELQADIVMDRKLSDLEVIDRCTCRNWGKEDGDTTCWKHHDCSRGDCTHGE